jgi:hypothetical protein
LIQFSKLVPLILVLVKGEYALFLAALMLLKEKFSRIINQIIKKKNKMKNKSSLECATAQHCRIQQQLSKDQLSPFFAFFLYYLTLAWF